MSWRRLPWPRAGLTEVLEGPCVMLRRVQPPCASWRGRSRPNLIPKRHTEGGTSQATCPLTSIPSRRNAEITGTSAIHAYKLKLLRTSLPILPHQISIQYKLHLILPKPNRLEYHKPNIALVAHTKTGAHCPLRRRIFCERKIREESVGSWVGQPTC